MKYILLTCRLLLGVAFAFFGSNHILNFLHPPPPQGDIALWSNLMVSHHYFVFVGVVQLVAGILLLVNRFVPLALTLLGPVLVNILLFHALFDPGGFAPGLACTLFWLVLFAAYYRSFLSLFVPNPEATTPKL
jgi:putative oxidoreductase